MEEETVPRSTSTTAPTTSDTPMKETNEDGQATTAVEITTTTAVANNHGTSEECQIEQGIEVTTTTMTTTTDHCNANVNNDNNNDNLQNVSSAVPVKIPPVVLPPIRGVDREEALLKDIQLVWPRNKHQSNNIGVVNGGWTKHQWDTSSFTRSLVHHGIVLVKRVPTTVASNSDGGTTGGESTLFAPSKEDTITIGEAIADVATEWWTNTTRSFWNNNTGTQTQQPPKHNTTNTNRGSSTSSHTSTTSSSSSMLVLMMIYHEPNMIVMARRPKDWKEADTYYYHLQRGSTDNNKGTTTSTNNNPPKDMWIIHSIVNPVVCKFRLSFGSLTMPSSSSKSMELITPHGNMIFTTNLSSSSELVPLNENDDSHHLEQQKSEHEATTTLWETILTETLMEAHNVNVDVTNVSSYYERHQILLGTLHSNVVLRDNKALEQQCVGLIQLAQQLKVKKQRQQQEAAQITEDDGQEEEAHNMNDDQGDDDDGSGLVADLLNARDVNGYTALHLACLMKSHDSIKILVDAGADVTLRTPHHSSGGDVFGNWYDGTTICHVCAILLDLPSLRLVLAAEPRLSNALDCSNRTPIHAMWLSSRQHTKHIQELLEQCTNTIGSWGGQLLHPMIWNTIDHPIHTLSSSCSNNNSSSSSLTNTLNMLLRFGQNHVDFLVPYNKRLTQQHQVSTSDSSPREQPQVIPLDGTSLSAFCQYPIHTTLLSLRNKIIQLQQEEEGGTTAQNDSSSKKNDNNDVVLQTLQVLLQNGFEPNERMDYIVWGTSKTQTTMHSFMGFAPLHIIALMALELQALMQHWMSKGKDVLTPNRVQSIQVLQQQVVKCSELLVSYGARMNLGAIMEANEIRAKSLLGDNDEEEHIIAKIESLRPWKNNTNITPSQLTLEDPNIKLWTLLGGKERLIKAYNVFSSKPTDVIVSTNKNNIFCIKEPPTGATATDKQQLPGSNNDVSCAICWSKFGTFSNRKHWCRTTHRHVCDSCSTKRLKMPVLPQSRGAQSSSSGAASVSVRITDGQYNLARYLSSMAATAGTSNSPSSGTTSRTAASRNSRKTTNSSSSTVVIGSGGLARSASSQDQQQRRFPQEQRQQRAHAHAQAQQQRYNKTKETQEKEELFGNVGKKMANLFGGAGDDDDDNDPANVASSSLSGMMSTLEGTRDALNERGTKLSSLSEKSSALADASKNFADMAKQLERQQRGGGGFFDW